MVAATVEAVYATGLLQLADARGERERVVEDCRSVAASLERRPELIALADSPRLSRAQAKDLLAGCFKAQVGEPVLKLILLCVDRNRLPELRAILAEIVAQADADAGRIAIEVTTAAELDGGLRERFEQAVRSKRGDQAQISYRVDPRLVGGLRAKVGDERVLDASVSRHLKEMKQRILEAPVTAHWDDSSEGASA